MKAAVTFGLLVFCHLAVFAEPPDAESIVEGALAAAGGEEAFATLGVLEIAINEEETLSDGTQSSKRITGYLDAGNPQNMRLELPGNIVIARNGNYAWAMQNEQLDDRPQTPVMAMGMMNQRLFPLLLPFSLSLEEIRLGEAIEVNFDGEPAWRLNVHFPKKFFISPSMSTSWQLHVRRSDYAVLAVEFLPPKEIRKVQDEGVRYRYLKYQTVGSVKLPAQVLLDGIDFNRIENGHVRVTKLETTIRGPVEPALFLHPEDLKRIEAGF